MQHTTAAYIYCFPTKILAYKINEKTPHTFSTAVLPVLAKSYSSYSLNNLQNNVIVNIWQKYATKYSKKKKPKTCVRKA